MVVKGNAQVLDKELNLLWLGFLGMLFDMLLAFHINLIKSRCCIQHTYAIFLFFLLTFLAHWESQCAVDRLWKKVTIYFVYELIILSIGLTFVALLTTIMSNILKTIYMKQKQKETIIGWWLWKWCIQIKENFFPMILRELWISNMC